MTSRIPLLFRFIICRRWLVLLSLLMSSIFVLYFADVGYVISMTSLPPFYLQTLVFLVLVVVTYSLLLLPQHVTSMIGDYMPSIYNHQYVHVLWIFFHWLAFCDTCTYPLLILYKRRKRRNNFRTLFCGGDNELRRISHHMFQNSGMMVTCFSFVTNIFTHEMISQNNHWWIKMIELLLRLFLKKNAALIYDDQLIDMCILNSPMF
jgi:hypothetical protein